MLLSCLSGEKNMRFAIVLVALLLSSSAWAAKDCEELKAEIDAKIQAKGVKGYTLEIVEKATDTGELRVVGTCGGDTKKITYKRG